MDEFTLNISIPSDHIDNIFGQFDRNIKSIENGMNISFILRDDAIKLIGDRDRVEHGKIIIDELLALSEKGNIITAQDVNYVMSIEKEKIESHDVSEARGEIICHTTTGKPVAPKTLGQKKYVDAISNNMIVFGVGPAGTGKTYLAMAKAITAFKNEEVSRIILTRPAIEAGEKLGFLPGDLQSKVDPYLRPLYDALYQIMGAEAFQRNMEKGLIEVAPLAYMRGRTLDNSFIILDEAQNTTPAQMKMFLTRIGFGSKAVITGDQTQKDLPNGQKSGLDDAMKVLKNIDDIKICTLDSKDVVRHPLVQKIVNAYEIHEKKLESKNKRAK
ncbi:phosphate starvation-inducible protein PhoH [Pseudobutyrivibrio sp. 49]|uniref:PhoH family protein n=1 Tax=unclassified Pseudobutyrivibrio TaxID=2638619 RepID=UPI00088C58A4|nr:MULTISPECIES: PhoH family protein [unclassified Pseudobutyrivibrio]SDH42729.1 phosphate starvation-inducible protein PhoH [Pseudobutyrivibrio sp. 49]SFN44896.1 phosphate starvation-inducible protein PhoH [Pseudobutyrivibrio sp. UC1225]